MNWRSVLVSLVCFSSLIWGNNLAAQSAIQAGEPSVTEEIEALLGRQDFETAAKRASAAEFNRDQLLGMVAVAQAKAGAADAAKSTLRQISSNESLTSAMTQLVQITGPKGRPEGRSGRRSGQQVAPAAGGASGADFDTLINLITSTVAPDTWDDVGGPGAIESFEGGVRVDAQGVLRQIKTVSVDSLNQLEQTLETARPNSTSQALADARRDSKLRMVSLTRLQRELQLRLAMGEPPTDAMKWLAGLREVRYVFVFPETQDLVIAGPAGDWDTPGQPALSLDDLVSLMRASGDGNGTFGCSISPKRENLVATQRFLSIPTGPLKPTQTSRWVNEIRETLGLQDISIRGVDPQSHVARVLVEADYHMKLIGMGLEPAVPGVESYLDSIEADEIPQSMQVLRWWFTIRPDAVRRNPDGDAYVFRKQVIRLQSEDEKVTDEGERVHTGQSSPLNQLFASRFTRNYKRLASAYPIYARLEGIFRLAMAVALINSDDVKQQVDWDHAFLSQVAKTAKGNVPSEVPSIVNHRVINRRHVVVGVSGGVTVDARTAVKQVAIIANGGGVTSDRESARPRFPKSSLRWWWD